MDCINGEAKDGNEDFESDPAKEASLARRTYLLAPIPADDQFVAEGAD
jgi:hypothetical protein